MRAPTPARFEEVHRALLEHARAHAMLDVVAVAALEDDGIDARAVQEVRQHEPGGPRADDADLRAPLVRHAAVLLGVPAQEQSIEIRVVQELRRRPVEREAPHLEHQRAVRILERGAHVLLDHQDR